jgi:hypothetical protein
VALKGFLQFRQIQLAKLSKLSILLVDSADFPAEAAAILAKGAAAANFANP